MPTEANMERARVLWCTAPGASIIAYATALDEAEQRGRAALKREADAWAQAPSTGSLEGYISLGDFRVWVQEQRCCDEFPECVHEYHRLEGSNEAEQRMKAEELRRDMLAVVEAFKRGIRKGRAEAFTEAAQHFVGRIGTMHGADTAWSAAILWCRERAEECEKEKP